MVYHYLKFPARQDKHDRVRTDPQVCREDLHELQDPTTKFSYQMILDKPTLLHTIRRHSEPSRKASFAAFTALSTSFYSKNGRYNQ